jgi:hypothetical protein
MMRMISCSEDFKGYLYFRLQPGWKAIEPVSPCVSIPLFLLLRKSLLHAIDRSTLHALPTFTVSQEVT